MNGPRRILLLDDCRTERELAREAVQEFACDLVLITVATPDEAAYELHRSTPSIVLIDLHLGRWNGRQLLPWLRGKAGAIILSTTDDPLEARLCLEAGAVAFWTKPLHFDGFSALFSRVRNVIDATDSPVPLTEPSETPA